MAIPCQQKTKGDENSRQDALLTELHRPPRPLEKPARRQRGPPRSGTLRPP